MFAHNNVAAQLIASRCMYRRIRRSWWNFSVYSDIFSVFSVFPCTDAERRRPKQEHINIWIFYWNFRTELWVTVIEWLKLTNWQKKKFVYQTVTSLILNTEYLLIKNLEIVLQSVFPQTSSHTSSDNQSLKLIFHHFSLHYKTRSRQWGFCSPLKSSISHVLQKEKASFCRKPF